MIRFAAMLVLATTVLSEPPFTESDPCFGPCLALARARLAAYEDPSPKRTDAVLEVALEQLGTFRPSALEKDPELEGCFSRLFNAAAQLGDAKKLSPLLLRLRRESTTASQRSRVGEYERSVNATLRERGLPAFPLDDEADSPTRVVRECSAAPAKGDCPHRIDVFLRVGAVEMEPLVLSLRVDREAWKSFEPGRRWLRLHQRYPNRRERLRVALNSPSVSGKMLLDPFGLDRAEESAKIRAWAWEDLLAGPDPRKWDPEDVALAIEVARGRLAEPYGDSVVYGLPVGRPLVRDAVLRLRGMGFVRTQELIGSTEIQVPSAQPDRNDLGVVGWAEHFDDEEKLYIREWQLNSADEESLESYVARRWRETDAAAPSPDLVKVRAILNAPAPSKD